MTLTRIDNIAVAMLPLDAAGPKNRRLNESTAVARIIHEYLGPQVNLTHSPDGAPHVDAPCHISVTHSRQLAAVAFCPDYPVGIDAELWRPTLLDVRNRYLSPRELEMFTSPQQLLTAWTIKEAVYKVAGDDATEFATAIAIAPDMRTAQVGNRTYDVRSFSHDDNIVTIAYEATDRS